MTFDIVAGVVLLATVLVLVVGSRHLIGPAAKSRSLAMTVWASLGPYDTVDRAVDALRQSARAVFGREGMAQHEKWIDGHVQNFTKWNREGTFARNVKIFRSVFAMSARGRPFEEAYAKVRDEIIEKGMAVLNEISEPAGYRWETAKQPSGALGFKCNQLLSDEEIQRKQQENGESIRTAVGAAILNGQSDAAHSLLRCINEAHRVFGGKEIQTAHDAGVAYHLCLELVKMHPEAAICQKFARLEQEWVQTAHDQHS